MEKIEHWERRKKRWEMNIILIFHTHNISQNKIEDCERLKEYLLSGASDLRRSTTVNFSFAQFRTCLVSWVKPAELNHTKKLTESVWVTLDTDSNSAKQFASISSIFLQTRVQNWNKFFRIHKYASTWMKQLITKTLKFVHRWSKQTKEEIMSASSKHNERK